MCRIRYEVKGPSNLKVSRDKGKVHRNEVSSSEPEAKKKGEEKVKTELESWVNTS